MDAELKAYLDQIRSELIEQIRVSETATKAELIEQVRASETATKAELIEQMRASETATKAELIEQMRAMQTELLRGFAAYSEVTTIRLRKVEADESNLNSALNGRMDVVEGRLRQIEMRLGLQ